MLILVRRAMAVVLAIAGTILFASPYVGIDLPDFVVIGLWAVLLVTSILLAFEPKVRARK